MSLVEQRNRFLSFAFASSDVLIETDMEGDVYYTAGASAVLGSPAPEDTHENFSNRLDRTSRPILKALMCGLKPGRRAGPARVSVRGRSARLCGWMLGDDERIRWTLSFDAVDAPEEIEPQAFQGAAESAIAAARELDHPMAMSVLHVSQIEEMQRQIGESAASHLRKAIFAAAFVAVGEFGVVRQVDLNRWALIHTRSADLNALKKEVEGILNDSGFGDSIARIESVADAPELEPEIAVQAFLHAVNMAADSGEALDITSLKDVAAGMMEETTKRMNELRTTIAGRVIEPHAQPIVNLETGEIHHYELLLRLPGGKPISESVGFAESTGLIYEIDLAMTEIAANFLRDDFDRPALAVNLSGKSLTNPAWGKKFLAMLADIKLDRSRLSFELTETATISNIKTANAVIQKIRERGHVVCLDDFGTGAAGFNYLRDFPADIIKIDGSYVRRSEKSERDQKLIKGMIALCSDLNTQTVAEMIESKSCAETMKALGVTYGQGYYFGKPIPLKLLADPRYKATRAA
jgi:EAL domain-containing protein (putative c-di-GMP-specific phosphodiesterase class I)